MSLRVLIAVTHLLGAGHLTRAAAIARAFARAGDTVTLVSGGLPARLIQTSGFALVQLPPVRIRGTDFAALLDENGDPVTCGTLQAREALLAATLDEVRPDVVITELFPFGRRVLAKEFTSLVERARALQPRPLIVASVRDILAPPTKPGRREWTQARLEAWYDAVLVHADPALVPLDASWPLARHLHPLLRYTGYVDEAPSEPAPDRAGEHDRRGIVVSGGSSAASLPLYRAALEAARLLPDERWFVLVGGGVPEAEFAQLQEGPPSNARVERARPDFRALLAQAPLSVSQAGYNTVVDLLQAKVPTVLVPFEAGHETEQRQRADRLAEIGLADVLPESRLSGPALAAAARARLGRSPALQPIALDGAERTVTIVRDLRATPRRYGGPALWSDLDRVLRRAAGEGRTVALWWRDDDAIAATPGLERLLALSQRYEIPLALAVIPHHLDPSLKNRLATERQVAVLVHGLRHVNHAPPTAKKAEFGPHRPLPALVADAQASLTAARERIGAVLPVFVPPWNRMAPELLSHLRPLGYRGLSAFRNRAGPEPMPGLVQVNTHVDPIDWRGARSLADPARILAALVRAIETRLDRTADPDEPVGLLTHHLVHDETVWSFCEALLDRLSSAPAVHYARADHLFLPAGGDAAER